METDARYFLIGLFTTVMLSAGAIFTIWFGGFNLSRDVETYDIYFQDSVAGLSVGGSVRYSGVLVGQVSAIRFDRNNPRLIRVTIEVMPETPVLRDTLATLELQGLTGVVFVQLVNTDPQSPAIEIAEGWEYPVIRSGRSKFDQLFSGAPDMINGAIIVLDRLNQLLGDDNLERIAGILENAESVTASLGDAASDLKPLLSDVSDALEDMERAAAAIENVADSAGSFVDDELPMLASDLGEAAKRLNETIDESGAALTGFTTTALPELSDFVSDARRLAATMNRIAERFEQSPIDFVLSGQTPTVELD